MSKFGLHTTHETLIKTIFSKHSCINKVLLYGSRAKGTYTDRSDVDLVITETEVDRFAIGSIISEINESNFPYLIDLQNIKTITNTDLLAHIERIGVVFYQKDNPPSYIKNNHKNPPKAENLKLKAQSPNQQK